jgi:hypothetical protein
MSVKAQKKYVTEYRSLFVSPRNASRLKSGPKKVLPISLADFGAAETGSDSGSSSESAG